MMEHLVIAVRNILNRKLRSWLTMLGIFIGIAGVVSLLALGNGLQDAVQKEFDKLGTNRILIRPAGANFGPLSGDLSEVKLETKDINAIRKSSGVISAGGLIAKNTVVKYKDEPNTLNIFFHDTDRETLETLEKSNLFNVEKGRELRDSDVQKIVIGYNVANDAFDRKLSTGDEVEIAGRKFQIVGIQKKTGAPPYDNGIRLSLHDIEKVIDPNGKFTIIIAIANPDGDVDEVADNIKKKLRSERDVKEGEEDFTVQTSKQIIQTVLAVFQIIQAVVVGIAAISLVVGAIGITNTMYTSVIERTKEIGIMKAIGATNKDIAMIFLFESGILGLLGSLMGLLIGLGGAKLVAMIARRLLESDLFQANVQIEFLLGIITFGFVLGCLAGVLPAMQASKQKPVDSLRYE